MPGRGAHASAGSVKPRAARADQFWVFLAILFGLAVASVALCGGRLSALAEMHLRGAWVIALALGVQILIITVAPGGSQTFHEIVHLSTYGAAGGVAGAHPRGAGRPHPRPRGPPR